MKIFTTIYILLSVTFLGWILGDLIKSVIEAHESRVKSFIKASGSDGTLDEQCCDANGRVSVSSAVAQKDKKRGIFWDFKVAVLTAAALILLPVCLGTLFAYFWDGHSFVDSVYWSVVTVTTVGFGDVTVGEVPEKRTTSRVVVLLFILVAVPCFGSAFGKFTDALVQLHSERLKADLLARKLSPEMLADLDSDGDGVDKVEFLCAMLLTIDKVSIDDLTEILDRFESLDADGSGTLTSNDLAYLRSHVHSPPGCRVDGRPTTPGLQVCVGDPIQSDAQVPAEPCDQLKEAIDAVEATFPLDVDKETQQEDRHPAFSSADVVACVVDVQQEDWQRLLDEVRQDNLQLAQRLTEEHAQLVQSLQANLVLQRSFQQETAQRQALHDELRLVQVKLEQLRQQHADEVDRGREAEARFQDVTKRLEAAEQRSRDLEAEIAALKPQTRSDPAPVESVASSQKAERGDETVELSLPAQQQDLGDLVSRLNRLDSEVASLRSAQPGSLTSFDACGVQVPPASTYSTARSSAMSSLFNTGQSEAPLLGGSQDLLPLRARGQAPQAALRLGLQACLSSGMRLPLSSGMTFEGEATSLESSAENSKCHANRLIGPAFQNKLPPAQAVKTHTQRF